MTVETITPATTALLPADLEAARLAVPVVDSLPVKGAPGGDPAAVRRLRTVRHLYERAGVLAHIGFAPDEGYALTDKTSPHAVHELMAISSGSTHRPGLHDHSPAFGRALGVLVDCFAAHCTERELTPVVSWSYDPATTDRPSIQGEKRFHAHLVGRTLTERAWALENTTTVAALPGVRRRRIAEEASVLGALLTEDVVDPDALRVLEPVAALSSPAATVAATFRLPGGWPSFTDPGLYEDLGYVHRKLERAYREILRACQTGTAGKWKRPVLDPESVEALRLPLSARTRGVLGHYLAGLRPERLEGVESAGRASQTHLCPLAGLAYAVTVTEHHGQVYAHIRLNVFSDLGGAGVTFIGGTVVKVRKSVGVMRADEVAARSTFQNTYLNRLCGHPRAGHALFPAGKDA